MPIIEKCGRSGVELREIRRHVNADGEDITPKGKPLNGYLDGKRKQAVKGLNCNRPKSHGAGMGPAVVEYVAAHLSKTERTALLLIHAGKTAKGKAIDTLVKKGLVEKEKNGWTYTYEGDQVVRRLAT